MSHYELDYTAFYFFYFNLNYPYFLYPYYISVHAETNHTFAFSALL